MYIDERNYRISFRYSERGEVSMEDHKIVQLYWDRNQDAVTLNRVRHELRKYLTERGFHV